jgi:hypothetical protein
MTNRSDIKESTNSGYMSHMTKCLIIISTMLLLKAASNKTSFVTLKRTFENRS